MENKGRFLKKLELYDPAIPLVGIYLEKKQNTNLKSHIHVALFIIVKIQKYLCIIYTAKIQKQPKYPSMDAWIKKMYIYIQYYSAIKMNEILPLVAHAETLRALSKTKNGKYFYDLTNMWNFKNNEQLQQERKPSLSNGEQIRWLPEVGFGE